MWDKKDKLDSSVTTKQATDRPVESPISEEEARANTGHIHGRQAKQGQTKLKNSKEKWQTDSNPCYMESSRVFHPTRETPASSRDPSFLCKTR